MCFDPVTCPGGKPVTALPGSSPNEPVTTVGPVFVIVAPPRTEKSRAVPSRGEVAAKADTGTTTASSAVDTITRGRIRDFNMPLTVIRQRYWVAALWMLEPSPP